VNLGTFADVVATIRALALALLALAGCLLFGWWLSGCAPLNCQTADIGIWPHPTKPKPAGTLIVTCDGKPKVVINADRVGAP